MSREQSAIIKGIAILLMLVYHLGNIGGIQGIDNIFYHNLSTASHPISYFMIVSGYGLYIAYNKKRLSWGYLLKRTLRLYLGFWLVLLIFAFGIESIINPGKNQMSFGYVIMNIFGYRWDYCLYTWFLLPYVLMSFSTKWIFPIIDRIGDIASIVCAMFIYLIGSFLVSRFFESWLQWHYSVYHVVLWSQTLFALTIGAVLSRQVISGKRIIWNKLYGKNFLVLCAILMSFAIRGLFHTSVLNPFHASVVIWLVLHIDFSSAHIRQVFIELGNKSMIMWMAQGFLIGLIFPEGSIVLQWPVVVWLLWVVSSYVLACILTPIVNRFSKILL